MPRIRTGKAQILSTTTPEVGSAIDPEIASFVAALRDGMAAHPEFAESDIARQREIIEQVRAPWRKGGPVIPARDIAVPTQHGEVRVRLFAPPELHRPAPTLIYLHGGGFAVFSLETHDRIMREYAAAGMVVAGVDYSLSPEARYPVALEETVSVIDWLAEHGAGEGVDPARLAIGGDSAGANLSLAAALTLRDRERPSPLRALVLNYGFFDIDRDTHSNALYGGPDELLTTEELAGYMADYIRHEADLRDPLVQPSLARLHDLPPSLHIVAECDPLADSCREMAARMLREGSRAELHVFKGATHSFLEAVSVSSQARSAFARTNQWLGEVLGEV